LDYLSTGLPVASIGDREPFDPDDYPGDDLSKLTYAGYSASLVGGAVTMYRMYEIDKQLTLYPGVMYTGGGIRRAPTPHAVVVSAVSPEDICIDVDQTIPYGHYDIAVGQGYTDLITNLYLTPVGGQMCASDPVGFDVPPGADIFNTFKLTRAQFTYSDGSEELYDLETDPNEWTNRADDPALEHIKAELAEWLPRHDEPDARGL